MKLEKEIEEVVRKWSRTRGFLCIKFSPSGERGWPDRIFISPKGVHVWIEFKQPGKRPTGLQWHRIQELRERGANAEWFDNPDDAIAYLNIFT